MVHRSCDRECQRAGVGSGGDPAELLLRVEVGGEGLFEA
jgi:hypothetical protein